MLKHDPTEQGIFVADPAPWSRRSTDPFGRGAAKAVVAKTPRMNANASTTNTFVLFITNPLNAIETNVKKFQHRGLLVRSLKMFLLCSPCDFSIFIGSRY
jgi:hypothetical protein